MAAAATHRVHASSTGTSNDDETLSTDTDAGGGSRVVALTGTSFVVSIVRFKNPCYETVSHHIARLKESKTDAVDVTQDPRDLLQARRFVARQVHLGYVTGHNCF